MNAFVPTATSAAAPWPINIFSCYNRAQENQCTMADYCTLFDTDDLDARTLIMDDFNPHTNADIINMTTGIVIFSASDDRQLEPSPPIAHPHMLPS